MSTFRQTALSTELKQELLDLCEQGRLLAYALQHKYREENSEAQFEQLIEEANDEADKQHVQELRLKVRGMAAQFANFYEKWYSKAANVIAQILPDRLADFRSQYERPRANRKEIVNSNYVVQDALKGVTISSYGDTIVSPMSAISNIETQVAILRSCLDKFESRLFEIRALLQADLFDTELDAAKALCKSGFLRAAGAMAGVVLESHLSEVASNHSITTQKKHLTISSGTTYR
ncbi:MAG: hypothetical protein R3C04_11680 [Hyphomonas sp.]